MAQSVKAAFYFDLASPECYLLAEHVLHALPRPLEWHPVLASALGRVRSDAGADPSPSPADEPEGGRAERGTALSPSAHALAADLQPLKLPDPFPFDSEPAMLAATYAKSIGRAVAFSQAAFRQAFAGGHSLAQIDYILIAGAACEIHPRALLSAMRSPALRARLLQASAAASAAGARVLPAIVFEGRTFQGAQALELALERRAIPA